MDLQLRIKMLDVIFAEEVNSAFGVMVVAGFSKVIYAQNALMVFVRNVADRV